MRERAARLLPLLALTAALLPAGGAAAQTGGTAYRIGAGDVLQLNVLQQPDLDAQLTVRPDGTAVIGRVGAVALTGLTVAQAEDLVRQRLQLFNPGITDVSLTVLEYNALHVYVLGAVASPGSYSFTTQPTLWAAIRAAGGPLETANLGAVRVVSQDGDLAQTRTYDLSALVSGRGAMPDVLLETDDSVVVPSREGVMTVPAEAGVQVFGNVGTPGVVSLTEPTRLVSVLMQAGSPLNDSKLHEVWWVHQEGPNTFRSTRVNMRLFLEEGSLAGNPLVYPGDTIRVPAERRGGWWRDALTVATATAAVALAIDRINSN